jgi:hypothetical protein
MLRHRRNADEDARRRERAMAAGPTQEMIDRVVLDKLRAGRPGEITLYELEHASLGLIPKEVSGRTLQVALDRTWRDPRVPEVARLEIEGADLTISTGDEDGNTLVFMLETSDDLEGRFTHGPGWSIPRVRFWVNESWVETGPDGEWVEG